MITRKMIQSGSDPTEMHYLFHPVQEKDDSDIFADIAVLLQKGRREVESQGFSYMTIKVKTTQGPVLTFGVSED